MSNDSPPKYRFTKKKKGVGHHGQLVPGLESESRLTVTSLMLPPRPQRHKHHLEHRVLDFREVGRISEESISMPYF